MSYRNACWTIAARAPAAFLAAIPEHPLLAQVLYTRGLTTPAAVQAFLGGEHAALENPFLLRDMDVAVERIWQALRRRETLCVYGDFDADGVSSTALLVSTLQALGGRVGPYIPDRVDEGYGLHNDAILRIAAQAQLLITVDCGIRSNAEVASAHKHNLDVIVTDHHLPGSDLPPALAVINPQRPECASRFPKLAGVGVAFRLAQALLRTAAQETGMAPEQAAAVEASLLDLVALGTVADLMPLVGQNRSLVRRGLAALNQTARTGLQALFAQADLRPGRVDAAAISFRIAPRLNAAGRLDDARLAYRLLRTQDVPEAQKLAATLERLNEQRRSLTETTQIQAEAQLASLFEQDPAILIARSPHFKPGIVGLVAGRLVERHYRPAVVIHEEAETARGSARSIPEFNISQALDQLAPLLIRHGGHHLAAGFTVHRTQLPAFCEALAAVAASALADRAALRPQLAIDAVTTLPELTWGLVAQLARLEPTGSENPPATLLLRNVRVHSHRTVGEGKHLRLWVDPENNGASMEAIAFHQSEWAGRLGEGSRLDLAFQLESNEWQGSRRIQLNVQGLRPATP